MAYLIPKSARTVKMEIFKGLGIVDCLIVAATVIAAYMILQIGALPFLPKAIKLIKAINKIVVIVCSLDFLLELIRSIKNTKTASNITQVKNIFNENVNV